MMIVWGFISKFLSSRMLSVALISVLSIAGIYVVSQIKQNAVLKAQLEGKNKDIEQLTEQLKRELIITQQTDLLNNQVIKEENHEGCDNPVILRNGIKRLHETIGR